MEKFKLFEAEYKLMLLIWNHEPINSTVLKTLCEKELSWKKSTTYSMIKRLKDRHVIKSVDATITSLVTKEEVDGYESEILVNKNFDGSLPSFVATFLKDRKLSAKEVAEILELLEQNND